MFRSLALVAAGALAATGVALAPSTFRSSGGTAEAGHCKVAALADVAGRYDYKTGAIPNAKMIASDTSVTRILVAGDLAYEDGTAYQFENYWRPAFGPYESKVFAVPGNHERTGSGTDGIEVELGDNADDNRGTTVCSSWRVVGLNPYKGVTKARDFIKAERVRYPKHHMLVLWHQPAYSSGQHGNSSTPLPLFEAAKAVGARIVVNGHDHNYERFAHKGTVRQFVSGLGGHEPDPFGTVKAGSEKRYTGKPGALFLTLNGDGSYSWVFRTIDAVVRDSGSQSAP